MKELERTYLAKFLPDGLEDCPSKEIFDIYIPAPMAHPKIRIRKNGDKYVIIKKTAVKEGDYSEFLEQPIELSEEEFLGLKDMAGKRLRKIRYDYDCDGQKAEVDVFLDDLAGLVLVDFEFENTNDKNVYQMPDFCLAEVTNAGFTAGGMLCGKSYEDIENKLVEFNYSRIEAKEESGK